MSGMYEHEELRALRSGVTPAAFPPEQVDRLLRHADECPTCAAELRDFAAQVILAQAPAARLDPAHARRLREHVLARAAPPRAPAAPDAARRAARRPGPRRSGGVGWMTAAVLAVALLTHHAFHQPLESGWLAAAGLAVVALGLGVYAVAQRRKLVELEARMSSPESGRPREAPEP